MTNAAAENRTTAKTKPRRGATRQGFKLNVHRHPEFVALLAMLLPG